MKVHAPATHACPVCSRSFRIKGHLRRHMAIHTGVRAYACDYCQYRCNVSSNLRKHLLCKHKVELATKTTRIAPPRTPKLKQEEAESEKGGAEPEQEGVEPMQEGAESSEAPPLQPATEQQIVLSTQDGAQTFRVIDVNGVEFFVDDQISTSDMHTIIQSL